MIFTDSILLRKICRRASGLFLPPPQENRRFSQSLYQFFRKNPTQKLDKPPECIIMFRS